MDEYLPRIISIIYGYVPLMDAITCEFSLREVIACLSLGRQLFIQPEKIPDVVWASNERLEPLLDEAGHLTGAPELVVEVLSPGKKNERRDREAKLKLYSVQGVYEYWIVNLKERMVKVYHREQAVLKLVATLYH